MLLDAHQAMANNDTPISKDGDLMHQEVDHAHLRLDRAELAYYNALRSMSWVDLTGYVIFPQAGEFVLQSLKNEIDSAELNLDWQTSKYNQVMGARTFDLSY
jgi:hypothetical protein